MQGISFYSWFLRENWENGSAFSFFCKEVFNFGIVKMAKILFLIAPSEGKAEWGENKPENLTFDFEKPLDIAISASEKDLKCKGKRYEEALWLNQNIQKSPTLPAILRYNGVMYNHIDYQNMSPKGKKFFDEHFLILSWMYGILRPQDLIANYKLPIETRGLYQFWGEKIIDEIISLKPQKIYNLLPWSYEKLLCLKKREKSLTAEGIEIIKPDFSTFAGEKLTHNTKILRWERIRQLCESGTFNL